MYFFYIFHFLKLTCCGPSSPLGALWWLFCPWLENENCRCWNKVIEKGGLAIAPGLCVMQRERVIFTVECALYPCSCWAEVCPFQLFFLFFKQKERAYLGSLFPLCFCFLSCNFLYHHWVNCRNRYPSNNLWKISHQGNYFSAPYWDAVTDIYFRYSCFCW